MCGIVGYINSEARPEPGFIVEKMADSIRHRGPDDFGYYRDSWAHLGFRRLAIIDLSGGHQPMTNEDGNQWLIYNGELFNHKSLRPALEAAGHRFVTRSDSEVILHSYEEYGPDCVSRFRGMFSFAIWDKKARRLYCARDRMGKKPFYYYWDGGLFAFASEIKALLEHPAISPKLEESLLPEYLAFGYVSEERTLFSGIRKLMPGHHLTLDISGAAPKLEIQQYWNVPEPVHEERDDASWIRECRERLEETVQMRLMSDVPLGVFLSGGVDSSAIAALVRQQAGGVVKTFAVGYAESEFSELSFARVVADRIGSDHHEVVVSADDFFEALPRLIWHEDEPLPWPSSVSLHFVAQLARKHVTVVLTGEGSDEMFGGYGRYHFYQMNQRWLPWYRLLPAGLRALIRRQVATNPLLAANIRRKLQHTFVGRTEDLESLYLDNFYAAFSASEQRLMFPNLQGQSPYANFRRYWDSCPGEASLPRLLRADQRTYLLELLMKQDQMSMANSLESRVPFLDHEFVEFSTRVPERMKYRNGEGKYLLKKAIEDLLPHQIIYRKKMGFPTPMRAWLRGPHARQVFSVLRAKNGLLASYIDGAALGPLLERQASGQQDATDRIWRLLNLQLWGEIFLKGNHHADMQEMGASLTGTGARGSRA